MHATEAQKAAWLYCCNQQQADQQQADQQQADQQQADLDSTRLVFQEVQLALEHLGVGFCAHTNNHQACLNLLATLELHSCMQTCVVCLLMMQCLHNSHAEQLQPLQIL